MNGSEIWEKDLFIMLILSALQSNLLAFPRFGVRFPVSPYLWKPGDSLFSGFLNVLGWLGAYISPRFVQSL